MEKFFVPREVWRPMNNCPMKNGDCYIVSMRNGTVKRMWVKQDALCFKTKDGEIYPPYEDLCAWINEPYREYLSVIEGGGDLNNEIPIEFIIPYIIKERQKAQREAKEACKAMNEAVNRANGAEAKANALYEKRIASFNKHVGEAAKLLNRKAVDVIAQAEEIIKKNAGYKDRYEALLEENKKLCASHIKLKNAHDKLRGELSNIVKLTKL